MEERLISSIYKYGPAPSLIAAHLGVSVRELKDLIKGSSVALDVYMARVGALISAINMFGDNRTEIARYLDTDRNRVSIWIEENPPAKEAARNADGVIWDLAKRNLIAALARGDWRATELVALNSEAGRKAGFGKVIQIDIEREAIGVGVDWQSIVDVVSNHIAEQSVRGLIESSEQGVVDTEDK